jgi:hypothetical protein
MRKEKFSKTLNQFKKIQNKIKSNLKKSLKGSKFNKYLSND